MTVGAPSAVARLFCIQESPCVRHAGRTGMGSGGAAHSVPPSAVELRRTRGLGNQRKTRIR
jgi:hypothetical protein